MRPFDPRLLRYAKRARVPIAGVAVLGVLTAGLVIVQAQLLATAIAGAFLHGATLASLRGTLIVLAVVIAARAVVAWASEAVSYHASAAVKAGLRRELLARVSELGPRWLASRQTATLTVLATDGIDALDAYFGKYLPQLVLGAVVPIAVVVRVGVADPLAGLTILCTLPLVPLFGALVGRAAGGHAERRWRTLSVLSHQFLDVVSGLPTLKVFGRAGAQRAAIGKVTDDYRRATLGTLRLAFLSGLVLELIATLSVALVAVGVGLSLVYGHLDLRTGLLALILAPEAYLPLRQAAAQFHATANGLAAASEALTLLETKPAAAPTPSAPLTLSAAPTLSAPLTPSAAPKGPAAIPPGVAALPPDGPATPRQRPATTRQRPATTHAFVMKNRSVKDFPHYRADDPSLSGNPSQKTFPSISGNVGHSPTMVVRVEEVSVQHADRTGVAPDRVSLAIRPGEITVLCGTSGCGKSTLIDVLLGFVQPTSGRIIVDTVATSVPIAQSSPMESGQNTQRGVSNAQSSPLKRGAEELREHVGWVGQEPYLFPGTVASNIRLGWRDAPDEAVAAAARAAALDDVPLDRPVTERTGGLSAGQRRRVALARALLPGRPILLLDEPTAGLDPDTEDRVLESLRREAAAGRAILIAAHHPRVIAIADHVVEMRTTDATATADTKDGTDGVATGSTATGGTTDSAGGARATDTAGTANATTPGTPDATGAVTITSATGAPDAMHAVPAVTS